MAGKMWDSGTKNLQKLEFLRICDSVRVFNNSLRLICIGAGKLRLERLDLYQITDLADRQRTDRESDGSKIAESAGLVGAFVEKF